MNSLAQARNSVMRTANEPICEMLSNDGKEIFVPKVILTQGAEAGEKVHKWNATFG